MGELLLKQNSCQFTKDVIPHNYLTPAPSVQSYFLRKYPVQKATLYTLKSGYVVYSLTICSGHFLESTLYSCTMYFLRNYTPETMHQWPVIQKRIYRTMQRLAIERGLETTGERPLHSWRVPCTQNRLRGAFDQNVYVTSHNSAFKIFQGVKITPQKVPLIGRGLQ